jgi:hypothetical protein
LTDAQKLLKSSKGADLTQKITLEDLMKSCNPEIFLSLHACALLMLIVSTLQTGSPRVPASRWVKGQSVCSRAATRSAALDPASLLGRAPVLPSALWLWILSLYQEGLRCCHASYGSGSHLPAREGSGVAMCSVAPNSTFLHGRALALPRILLLSMGCE